MSRIIRVIAYLYLYEKNNKMQNCGFAKIEKQSNRIYMKIQLKETQVLKEDAPIYFCKKGNGLILYPVGTLEKNMKIKEFYITTEDVAFDDTEGMVILIDQELMYASMWKDDSLEREKFHFYGEEEIPVEEESVEDEVKEEEESVEDAQLKATELGGSQPNLVERPVDDTVMKKIQLSDLEKMPEMFRIVSTNSFLLHGYKNYGYIVIGKQLKEDEELYYIGVPGVFQREEKVMAAIFGFSEFLYTEKDFGYWCHFIKGENPFL